jgi:voltage-gated potassium channel
MCQLAAMHAKPKPDPEQPLSGHRFRIHEIIFEADTREGKLFDIVLLVLILLSVVTVMLESIDHLNQQYHVLFRTIEWVVTILFTIEYALRIYSLVRPWKYITSFYGIIDLLAIIPTYLSLILVGSQYLVTIRALRLLRIFRILKLGRMLRESNILLLALRKSRSKVFIFFVAVLTIVVFVGSLMYVVEGSYNPGYSSIPRSIYWAIVTITTVGYGDITPVTTLGQVLSAMLMITGYAIIAVPTGIVTMEMTRAQKYLQVSTQACMACGREGHDPDAEFCKFCGAKL